jgi:hypothetical protein
VTSPDQIATFDQRHAEVATSLDLHIRAYQAHLAEGERREVAIAAVACWLRDHAEHEAVAELLAVAIDRLHVGYLAEEVEKLTAARNRAASFADDLAGVISEATGVPVGEHSNMNDPWGNALAAGEDLLADLRDRGLLPLNKALGGTA